MDVQDPPADDRQLEERHWKERRAAGLRAGAVGEADVRQCDQNLQRLADAAKAARPWAARVQAATHALGKAQVARERVEEDLAAARAAVGALEAAHAVAVQDERLAAQQLEAVQAEPQLPAATQPAVASMEEAIALLRQMANQAGVGLAAVAARLQEPLLVPVVVQAGAQPQVEAAVQQLQPMLATQTTQRAGSIPSSIPPGQPTPPARSRSRGRDDEVASEASARAGSRGRGKR